jgi:hypothetical protein
VHVFIRTTLLVLIVLGAKSWSTQQLLAICCNTLVSCSLLFIGTHFNVNEILVFFWYWVGLSPWCDLRMSYFVF